MKTWLQNRSQVLTSGAAMVVLVLLTLPYQNCTAPISSGIKSQSALAASMPFAYDAQVDQIGYMSCSELTSGYDTSQYFMLRAGAYGTSAGISLTSSFLSSTQGGYLGQRSDLLQQSLMNSGTKVMLSMRNASDFESTYPSTNTLGVDWRPIFDDLGLQETSDPLVAAAVTSAPKLRYLSSGMLPGYRFEGDLGGQLGASPMQQYRTYFNSSQILFGINFMSKSGASYARAPADFTQTHSSLTAHQSVYGRGLYLNFARPSVVGLASTLPDYTLSSVQEYDMQNRAAISSSWSCPTTLQFRIVRAEDLARANVNCVAKADSANAAGNQALVKTARNTLRAEDWYIDADDKCIIPKKVIGAQCYGSIAGLRVQYDETQACSAPATTGSMDTSTCAMVNGVPDTNSASCVVTNATCVHYASICVRN